MPLYLIKLGAAVAVARARNGAAAAAFAGLDGSTDIVRLHEVGPDAVLHSDHVPGADTERAPSPPAESRYLGGRRRARPLPFSGGETDS